MRTQAALPTQDSLTSWLTQLQADRDTQQQRVEQATTALDAATRRLDQIARRIAACQAMITALQDAGLP